MGNLISPPQNTLVLIPARFETRGLTRPVEAENPMDVYFGNLFRREILRDLHSFRGSCGLDILLAPEVPPTTAAHISLGGSFISKTVDIGSLDFHFNNRILPRLHSRCRISLSEHKGLTGYGMLTHYLDAAR